MNKLSSEEKTSAQVQLRPNTLKLVENFAFFKENQSISTFSFLIAGSPEKGYYLDFTFVQTYQFTFRIKVKCARIFQNVFLTTNSSE